MSEEVAPQSICDGFCKEWIVLFHEPIREGVATVLIARDRHGRGRSYQELRRDNAVVLRMLHVVVRALIVNDLFPNFVAGAETYGGEERSHLVILILRPAFEWMIVALCADHANA